MMPWYEVIFETGAHSVAFYEDDAEAQLALQAHEDRAKSGEMGTPASTTRPDVPAEGQAQWPAERIVKANSYDQHPVEYEPDMSKAAMDNTINALPDDSTPMQAAAALRGMQSPIVNPETPHDSMYAQQPTGEVTVS